jgi:hypothetical protein
MGNSWDEHFRCSRWATSRPKYISRYVDDGTGNVTFDPRDQGDAQATYLLLMLVPSSTSPF